MSTIATAKKRPLSETTRKRSKTKVGVPSDSAGAKPNNVSLKSRKNRKRKRNSKQSKTTTATLDQNLEKEAEIPQSTGQEKIISKSFGMIKPLVILDLNGTVLKRSKRSATCQVHSRPFLNELLDYLFGTFSVMVWSSARPESVQHMLTSTFGGYQDRLVACWDRRSFNLGRNYYNKVPTVKDLTKVWNCLGWNELNTIILDDTMDKVAQHRRNWIPITTWTGQSDDELLRYVKLYLKNWPWEKQQDVREYFEQTPFSSFALFNEELTKESFK